MPTLVTIYPILYETFTDKQTDDKQKKTDTNKKTGLNSVLDGHLEGANRQTCHIWLQFIQNITEEQTDSKQKKKKIRTPIKTSLNSVFERHVERAKRLT